MNNNSHCKNCDNPLKGEYCLHCGQRASVDKVTFRETFGDFVESVFSVNAPLFVTLKLLFVNPGKLFRDYLSGKRKRYYKPVTFFVLMTIVYLVIRSLINHDPFKNSTIIVSDESTSQLLTQARDFMLLNLDRILFILVFVLGLFLKLFYYRKQTLAEYLAIAFYLVGVYSIFTTLNMFFTQYVSSFRYMALLVMTVYFIYAMLSFHQRKKILVTIKSFVLFYMSIFFYGFLAFGLSFLIVWSRAQ